MGCGGSTQNPGQVTPAVVGGAAPEPSPVLPGPKEAAEDLNKPEMSTENNSMASQQPDPPKVLQLAVDTSIPKESKVKKMEDIEGLTYLQKIEKHAVPELNISRWTGKRAAGQPLDIPELSTHLKKAKALRTLYLGKNNLDDSHVKMLSEGLLENASLTRLSLDFNEISEEGCASLAGVLKTNKTLQYLDLNNNKLTDSGATTLAGAISSPDCVLQVLNLNNNNIGEEGARAFADGLRVNRSIETMSLSLNKMGSGCDALAAVLDTNHTLTNILLMKCGASLDTSIKIKRALRRNMAMKELVDHKIAFLLGCLPKVGKKDNKSSLLTVLVRGEGFDTGCLEMIWNYMHN